MRHAWTQERYTLFIRTWNKYLSTKKVAKVMKIDHVNHVSRIAQILRTNGVPLKSLRVSHEKIDFKKLRKVAQEEL